MDFWLCLACFGLGVAFMVLLGRIIEARARHLVLSKQGREGTALREQYKAEREKEENENGKEAALALAQALKMHGEGEKPLEILKAVGLEHPAAVWFILKKVISGELNLGELSKMKSFLGGGLGGN